ncbi:metallophosphoesterase family protein [Thalassococcus sp. BH17M4-6]|uniref:metallophosphoesterase family protein n=1 Tax=Thalassococcus sp. BH17M4-6 TaxID=3413148 RepID=UPI003BCB5BCB
MRITDLGRLSGPVLAFGGPYSNLAALRAMRDRADALAVPPENVICTGDVVAYCAEAAECVALMRDWGVPVVAGNCELQLAAGALDCGCGFEDGTVCDLLSAGWYAHANAACDAGAREWMGTCPDMLTFEHAGRRVAVIHGGVHDVARFIWPVSPDEVFAEEISHIKAHTGDVDLVIAGHSGLPFERRVGPVTWLNAGVIGMPPHDGTPATRFALLPGEGAPDILTLDYDPTPTVAAMARAGLTQGYDRALLSGWWPSEDVLPPALRRGTDQSRAIG